MHGRSICLLVAAVLLSCHLLAQEKAIGIEFQNSIQINEHTHRSNNQFLPFFDLSVTFSNQIGNNFSVVPRLGISYLRQRDQFSGLVDRIALINNPSNPTWQDSPQLSALSIGAEWPLDMYYNTLYVESGILLYYHIPKIPELSIGLGPVVRIPFYYTTTMSDTNGFKNINANFVERIDPSVKFEIAHSWKINEKLLFKYASNYTRNFINYFHDNFYYDNRHYWGGQAAIYFIL